MPKGTRNCGCPSKRCYCHCARDPFENRCAITTPCRPSDNGASWDPMASDSYPSTHVGGVAPGANWAGLSTCCGGGSSGGGGGGGGGGGRDWSSHGPLPQQDSSQQQQQQMMIRTFVKRPRPNKDVLWAARFFFLTFFKPAYKEKDAGSSMLPSGADPITSLALATRGTDEAAAAGGGGGGGGGGGSEAMAMDTTLCAGSSPLLCSLLSPPRDIDSSKYVVVHELANMYMWSFKDAMSNALGPGQLHSFINGRSFGDEELVFPYPPAEGFTRTYPLLHKDYHLKNPLGGPFVGSGGGGGGTTGTTPSHGGGTPRASIGGGAGSFSPLSAPASSSPSNVNTPASSPSLTVGDQCATSWQSLVKGVLACHSGPVTASKTVYEDAHGYLIRVALPYVDKKSVRVTWRNTAADCVVKVTATSIGGGNTLMRNGRIFKLADANPEICKTGLFSREVHLPLLLPPNSNLIANFDPLSTGLEIMVPKLGTAMGETEVPVTILNKVDRQAVAMSSGINNYENHCGSSGCDLGGGGGGGGGGRGGFGGRGGGDGGGGSHRHSRAQSLCSGESPIIDSRGRQTQKQQQQRQQQQLVARSQGGGQEGGGGEDGCDGGAAGAQGRGRASCCGELTMDRLEQWKQQQQQQKPQRPPEGGGEAVGSGERVGEGERSVPLGID
ncbi:hypothetical protein CBR_g34723 [Chara braunii]|uniref:SHSP domain-containing protein n=1 Tax=Chara braunii TaxID=69332 RepID=A0A388JZ16_CHABU|nr:hypothetical protein CBR_g34723 [Chara braunii]|eukprot:GBG63022.1 hypothetical protein CBR_g34723 [Chara braunii]